MGSATEEWRWKDREAAKCTDKVEVEKEARGEGKVRRRGAKAEVVVANSGVGHVYKWEEGGAISQNWTIQGHQRVRNPRIRVRPDLLPRLGFA